MDDTGGNNVDTGVHGDQLRLLVVLVDAEVSAGDITGGAELSVGGVRHGEGVWVVFRGFAAVPAPVGRDDHFCADRAGRLRRPVARHPADHLTPLLPGNNYKF